MKIFLLLIAVLASMVFAGEDESAWGKPVDGLKLQVLPTKPAFTSGEEVKFKFVVANVSGKEIHFFKGGLWHFVELIHGGKPIRRADLTQDYQLQITKGDFIAIPPGKTWEAELNYSQNWLPEHFLRTGKMTARYDNPSYDGHAFGLKGWTGTLVSNEFDYRIK